MQIYQRLLTVHSSDGSFSVIGDMKSDACQLISITAESWKRSAEGIRSSSSSSSSRDVMRDEYDPLRYWRNSAIALLMKICHRVARRPACVRGAVSSAALHAMVWSVCRWAIASMHVSRPPTSNRTAQLCLPACLLTHWCVSSSARVRSTFRQVKTDFSHFNDFAQFDILRPILVIFTAVHSVRNCAWNVDSEYRANG